MQKIRSFFRTLSATLLALLVLSAPAFAQTALTSTTLNGALSDSVSQQMVITSTTGWSASSTSVTNFALVDRELVRVLTVNTSSKAIGIVRGQLASRAAPHISGATVWFVPSAAIYTYPPAGQCTRANQPYVPWVVSGGPNIVSEIGTMFDCLGVGSSGQWVETNGGAVGLPVLGSTVASATSVTPTGTYFKMSGTVNPVSTIALPAGWAPGNCLLIEPTGAWVTDTAGNILIASTAVSGKVLAMCWNGTKWGPSY
jgi:hypothetical protein